MTKKVWAKLYHTMTYFKYIPFIVHVRSKNIYESRCIKNKETNCFKFELDVFSKYHGHQWPTSNKTLLFYMYTAKTYTTVCPGQREILFKFELDVYSSYQDH